MPPVTAVPPSCSAPSQSSLEVMEHPHLLPAERLPRARHGRGVARTAPNLPCQLLGEPAALVTRAVVTAATIASFEVHCRMKAAG